jgi:hypothetical protein
MFGLASIPKSDLPDKSGKNSRNYSTIFLVVDKRAVCTILFVSWIYFGGPSF